MKARPSKQRPPNGGSQPPRPRRRFTHEFKLEAVRLAAVGDRRMSELARDLGIRPEMLRQWRRQAEARAGERPAAVVPGSGKLISQDEEIRRLRRENAVLREERDILGKATAFFAKSVR
jgi:transposase